MTLIDPSRRVLAPTTLWAATGYIQDGKKASAMIGGVVPVISGSLLLCDARGSAGEDVAFPAFIWLNGFMAHDLGYIDLDPRTSHHEECRDYGDDLQVAQEAPGSAP